MLGYMWSLFTNVPFRCVTLTCVSDLNKTHTKIMLRRAGLCPKKAGPGSPPSPEGLVDPLMQAPRSRASLPRCFGSASSAKTPTLCHSLGPEESGPWRGAQHFTAAPVRVGSAETPHRRVWEGSELAGLAHSTPLPPVRQGGPGRHRQNAKVWFQGSRVQKSYSALTYQGR